MNETKLCPKCNLEMKFVQAGFSQKKGKNYNAFWSRKDWACKTTAPANQNPEMTQNPTPANQNAPSSNSDLLAPVREAFKKHTAEIIFLKSQNAVLRDRIEELEKQFNGLHGALITEDKEKAYELHRGGTDIKDIADTNEINIDDIPFG